MQKGSLKMGAGRFGFAMRAAYALKFWFYAQADAGG